MFPTDILDDDSVEGVLNEPLDDDPADPYDSLLHIINSTPVVGV